MDLGANIKTIRKLRNLSQEELGVKIGVKKQHVSGWENNKYQPSKENLDKLATSLGVKSSDFYNFVDEKHTPVTEGKRLNEIPFYDTVAVGGTSILAEQNAIYGNQAEMINPGTWFRSANGALRVYGHSMFPKYPAGCIVAFKESEPDLLIWGEDYVIELKDRRIVKRVEKSKQQGYITAVSYNKSEDYVYSPIEIPVTKIKRIFMVMGKVEMEASI